jgi:hypothetical protein
LTWTTAELKHQEGCDANDMTVQCPGFGAALPNYYQTGVAFIGTVVR